MKKLANVPLEDILDIVPDWCTHITVHACSPDEFLFESVDWYQAGAYGVLDGRRCHQECSGIEKYAMTVESLKQILKDDTA